MSVLRSLSFAAVVGLGCGFGSALLKPTTAAEDQPEGVYELRTYTTLEGRLPALHARFRDHTMRLFEKHGMKNVMYWTPTDPKKADNTLIYVLWHKSEEMAKKSWDDFRNDTEWNGVREASEKDGKIVSSVVSVYMKATDYSPKMK